MAHSSPVLAGVGQFFCGRVLRALRSWAVHSDRSPRKFPSLNLAKCAKLTVSPALGDFLAPEFPIHYLHRLSRVLAARLLPPGEVEDRAHALTGRAKAAIAHLMHSDEVLGLAFGRLREEMEQTIAFRESLFRVGIRLYLANVHSDRIVTGFWLTQHLHCWRARTSQKSCLSFSGSSPLAGSPMCPAS